MGTRHSKRRPPRQQEDHEQAPQQEEPPPEEQVPATTTTEAEVVETRLSRKRPRSGGGTPKQQQRALRLVFEEESMVDLERSRTCRRVLKKEEKKLRTREIKAISNASKTAGPRQSVRLRNRDKGRVARVGDLPHVPGTRFMEERVRLEAEKLVDADFASKLHVRQLYRGARACVVEPEVVEHLGKQGLWTELPTSPDNGGAPYFPATIRSFALFYTRKNMELMTFGMYVAEYGHDCPPPNRGITYISFLDSRKHEELPRHLRSVRTALYHQLLLSYLETARQRNFRLSMLWSCPGSFIFNGPSPQKLLPDKRRLLQFYRALEQKGVQQKVMDSTSLFFDHFLDFPPSLVPHIEGHLFPDELVEVIRHLPKNDTRGGQAVFGGSDVMGLVRSRVIDVRGQLELECLRVHTLRAHTGQPYDFDGPEMVRYSQCFADAHDFKDEQERLGLDCSTYANAQAFSTWVLRQAYAAVVEGASSENKMVE